ncbi:MAG: HAD hydrolase family protein, partial [Erysipelotrichaceae bacterium]
IPTLSIALSQSTYADLIQCNVNKYVGIKKLLDYLNIEEYIGFGDSMNDLEMLQHATCSILMGQGDKELIPYVDFITKAVDQDGIYYACKTLSLF